MSSFIANFTVNFLLLESFQPALAKSKFFNSLASCMGISTLNFTFHKLSQRQWYGLILNSRCIGCIIRIQNWLDLIKLMPWSLFQKLWICGIFLRLVWSTKGIIWFYHWWIITIWWFGIYREHWIYLNSIQIALFDAININYVIPCNFPLLFPLRKERQ